MLLEQIRKLIRDTNGAIGAAELAFVGTVMLIGLLVGFTSIRDSIVSELSDVVGCAQDSNQSYTYHGVASRSGVVAGSSFQDQADHDDDSPDDPAGAADNCITFDGSPVNEGPAIIDVADDDQVLLFDFSDGVTDSSSFGNDNSGTLQGGATVVDGELLLDSDNDFVAIPNSSDINTTTVNERTTFVEFTPNDITSTQVVYEEGGNVRGFNIYIEDGQVYVGAYNLIVAEGVFSAFLSTPIVAGQAISVTTVFDATVGTLTGFINGAAFGVAPAGTVFGHAGAIGLGGAAGRTVLESGVINGTNANGFSLDGSISSFGIYNRTLSNDEVFSLAQ